MPAGVSGFISFHIDRREIFHNSRSELFHILPPRQNISLEKTTDLCYNEAKKGAGSHKDVSAYDGNLLRSKQIMNADRFNLSALLM